MAKSYKATEYMYSSARLRALETKIASKEEIVRFADFDSAQSILSSLGEHGFEIAYKERGEISREDTLISALEHGFAEVRSMECSEYVSFLQYQYDCNNIKAIIKCNARNISPDDMLLSLGTVSTEKAKEAFLNKDYSAFPEAMAEAILEAEEAFAATANPQKIDFILDRACFKDMLSAARQSGVELAQKLVVCKIDLVNIMQTVRILKMGLRDSAEALIKEVYIEGGSLDKECFTDAVEDEESFVGTLFGSNYYQLAQMMSDGASLGDMEKKADNIYLDIAKQAKSEPFGAEVAIGYILALEYEVKNIRIVLAGKEAGLSAEVIRERLRDCYV